MNLQLEVEYSKADVLNEVAQLKAQIDAKRPLPDDIEGRVMQKLRLEWNYNSNAIEGNKLNYGETVALLMHGITAKGKPLKDHLDIQGHNDAINFLLGIVKEDRPFTESDIRGLHKLILVEPYSVAAQTADGQSTSKMIKLGEYKSSPNHVQTITGEIHYYTSPHEVPVKMGELMEWYSEVSSTPEIHPIATAALFHHKFVAIHPFDDGNGRLSRILMNLILMKNSYPPVVIKMDDRQNYYSLLSQADIGESWPFVEYIAERLKSSLNLYVKAINGQDIDEDEDIDKKISLLKAELKSNLNLNLKRSRETIKKVVLGQIEPLFTNLIIKKNNFNELFFHSHSVVYGFLDEKVVAQEEVDENSLNTTIEKLLKQGERFSDLTLSFYFNQFRNKDYPFDLKLSYSVQFHEFFYNIVGDPSTTLISKLYDEVLLQADKANVFNHLINSIQRAIENKKAQSPKNFEL